MTERRPAATPRILVIEDNETLRLSVSTAIADLGADVRSDADGSAFEAALANHRPHLVVLDIMLPGRDGLELLRVARRSSDAAVLMLTARDSVSDRVTGLTAGADDYLVKPFAMAELLARVTAVLRRHGAVATSIECGDVSVDTESGDASRGGHALNLTATEWKLLSYLAAQRGRTVSKTQILTQVWGYDAYDENLVEVHISALRRKLEEFGPRILHTRRGIGYVLAADTVSPTA
ncbi:response regulator transcription factor [Rhodococcus sp. SORGH_AS_0301]|uniref:response regulator transcription factor n=1 Tax=Rhodococcus sp. SORGH_AS_0301 TaxID=3041780 RepID=UPI002785F525|nr:response regulator transcription factor [Rhodococcus sp. SORGH_AS_0301]MDQ1182377.1 DNA-binding response OmpR family regulator [Rhodococcus sp. SORGH_AS_0301]